MSYDHHAAARALAARLGVEGQDAWAGKLERALEEGAIGTEILMGPRWQLQQLKGNGDSLSEETMVQIDELLRESNAALR